MTNETGEKSNQQQSSEKPWERVWNSLKGAVAPSKKETPTEPSRGLGKPWERTYEYTPIKKKEESAKFNLEAYLSNLSATESSNDPNAKASTSSASGLFQFTSGTWIEQVSKSGKQYTLNDRFDPDKAREIVIDFTKRNMEKARRQLEREPTATELYLYHFLGSPKRLIEAPADKPAKEFVSASAVRANKSVFYNSDGKAKTVGEVMNRFKQRFEGK